MPCSLCQPDNPEVQAVNAFCPTCNSYPEDRAFARFFRDFVLPGLAPGAKILDVAPPAPQLDLVITDMNMGYANGIDLAKEIHRRNPDMPVILLSSVGFALTQGDQAHFKKVLTKPVKQMVLFENILNELRKQAQEEEKQAANPAKLFNENFANKHPMQILLADDNLINQKLIGHILEKLAGRE